MSHRRNTMVLALAVALSLSAGLAAAAPGAIRISQAWIPPTPNAAPTAAGYLTITNTGRQADRLTGVSSPVAATVEPHHMSMAHGVMSMRPIQGGVVIGPGRSVTFGPGGDHLMLIGLKHPLTAGERVPARLRFEHAGAVEVEFKVERPAAHSAMHGMDMH